MVRRRDRVWTSSGAPMTAFGLRRWRVSGERRVRDDKGGRERGCSMRHARVESVTAIRRRGSDIILTYFAPRLGTKLGDPGRQPRG